MAIDIQMRTETVTIDGGESSGELTAWGMKKIVVEVNQDGLVVWSKTATVNEYRVDAATTTLVDEARAYIDEANKSRSSNN